MAHHDVLVVTPPGLEAITAREVRGLGAKVPRLMPGGVPCRLTTAQVYAANLWLRTASRVLVSVTRPTAVESFDDLERLARRVPWERWLAPGTPVVWAVSSSASRLYHTGAVAERLALAAARRVPGVHPAAHDDPAGFQRVVARLHHDRLTLRVDASGEHLHRRGYRLATAKAPLRETLAAAMLLGAGWPGDTPLADPFCGSGTIAIEAALLARRRPPGERRAFAFEHWPSLDTAAWDRTRAAATERLVTGPVPPVLATDRDAGAVAAAVANAVRAGVEDDLEVRRAAVSDLRVPATPGWLVANPPYGHRIGDDRHDLRDLYARLGQVLRTRAPAWHVALLVPDGRLAGQVGLAFDERFRTSNGGRPVRLLTATVPAAAGHS